MAVNMQFDREKMRAVILHICHACEPSDLGAVKLHKVLYYLDMLTYADQRRAVTGATYRKRPNGPASDQLLFTLREMERQGDIRISEVDYHGFLKKEYIPLVSEPIGVLSPTELALLDEVIDFVCRQNTAKSIGEFSHSLPWEMADMGGEIPYRSAMLLFPMDPTPEAFEVSEEGLAEIAAAKSTTSSVDLPLLQEFRSRLLSQAGQH